MITIMLFFVAVFVSVIVYFLGYTEGVISERERIEAQQSALRWVSNQSQQQVFQLVGGKQ